MDAFILGNKYTRPELEEIFKINNDKRKELNDQIIIVRWFELNYPDRVICYLENILAGTFIRVKIISKIIIDY